MQFTRKDRVTPDWITSLKDNEIFVFGSNLSGIHGAGAARMAKLLWGAKWGNPAGLQGRTYAIPTKDKGHKRTLSLEEIKPFVDEFIEFAKENPKLIFLVTDVGCGLAMIRPKDMAPLFKAAFPITNIHLPNKFWDKLVDDAFAEE